MTLEEAIKHCEEKAQGCDACAQEHRQLAMWLKELIERRKAAAKYFGISLDEFDHRDYEGLANQVKEG